MYIFKYIYLYNFDANVNVRLFILFIINKTDLTLYSMVLRSVHQDEQIQSVARTDIDCFRFFPPSCGSVTCSSSLKWSKLSVVSSALKLPAKKNRADISEVCQWARTDKKKKNLFVFPSVPSLYYTDIIIHYMEHSIHLPKWIKLSSAAPLKLIKAEPQQGLIGSAAPLLTVWEENLIKVDCDKQLVVNVLVIGLNWY